MCRLTIRWTNRGERGDGLLEPGVPTERSPKRHQFQPTIAERSWNVSSRGKLFKREILLANPRRADRKPLNHYRPIERIFLHRQKLDRTTTFAQCLLLSTHESIDLSEDTERRCIAWLRLNNFLL